MSAIPSHDTATVDTPWDGPGAQAAAPNDREVLVYMHAWRDAEGDPDAKQSYKFPHHAPEMGSAANLPAVRNALARLSQADIPESDRAAVERHLRNHLEEAERGMTEEIQTRSTEGFVARDHASDDGVIRFVAATTGRKGDGISLNMRGANLDRFKKSPVIMWGHDYTKPPIGRADVFVQGGALMADVTFDVADPFAAEVARKYRDGFLNAVSVGFDFTKIERDGTVNEWQLLEISAVPIPMDPDALMERQRAFKVQTENETPVTIEIVRNLIAEALADKETAEREIVPVVEEQPEEVPGLDATAVRSFLAAFDKE